MKIEKNRFREDCNTFGAGSLRVEMEVSEDGHHEGGIARLRCHHQDPVAAAAAAAT